MQCSCGSISPQDDESGILDCAEMVQHRCPSAELKLGNDLLRSSSLLFEFPESRPDKSIPALATRTSSAITPKLAPVVQHSEEEWNNMRSLITNLYIGQQLSLESVIRRMESEHQFRARCLKSLFLSCGWVSAYTLAVKGCTKDDSKTGSYGRTSAVGLSAARKPKAKPENREIQGFA